MEKPVPHSLPQASKDPRGAFIEARMVRPQENVILACRKSIAYFYKAVKSRHAISTHSVQKLTQMRCQRKSHLSARETALGAGTPCD